MAVLAELFRISFDSESVSSSSIVSFDSNS